MGRDKSVKNLDSWEMFENELQELQRNQTSVSPYLFRGHEDFQWSLATTLERIVQKDMSLKEYYRIILTTKPQVETLTGYTWDVMSYSDFEEWVKKYDAIMFSELPGYEFITYLRHHGFPTPLLDWTLSPYIAAYFAFRHSGMASKEKVSIFALCERPEGMKVSSSDESTLHIKGPYIRTHKRHFLQKSVYTYCASYDDGEWVFASHEEVFARAKTNQDVLIQFNIPASEREKVLKKLDAYNLNAYSLFGTDESLMETLAFREFY